MSMRTLSIEKADGGYIINTPSGKVKVVLSFTQAVQFMAGWFCEKTIGEDWKPE